MFFLPFLPYPHLYSFWTVVPPSLSFFSSKSERVWVSDVYACEDEIEGTV